MTTQEKIEIMQAYADGKQIEVRKIGESVWANIQACPSWNWQDNDYRIKPELTYRPYKDFAEFRKDWERHGGWVVEDDGSVHLCTLYDTRWIFKYYRWSDDRTPCGVKVED